MKRSRRWFSARLAGSGLLVPIAGAAALGAASRIRTAAAASTARNSGFLIQSTFGAKGNFEVVTPGRATGLLHLWRNNDAASMPWSTPTTIATGVFAGATLIQSNFGTPGRGNLEVVARSGNQLVYFSRDDQTLSWTGPTPIASGVTGNPALIQGTYGTRGNFELVTPMAGGGIGHYWRDNDDPALAWHGPNVFATGGDQISGVALIQSTFGNPGNLEVIATAGMSTTRKLLHFWRDNGGWQGPFEVPLSSGFEQPEGVPAFIQASSGNFEVVFPSGGHLSQVGRNNAAAGFPWGPVVSFAGFPMTGFGRASLIQSNYGSPGNLEAVAQKFDAGPGQFHINHYWRFFAAGSTWSNASGDLPV
jgi:hypothetical protein